MQFPDPESVGSFVTIMITYHHRRGHYQVEEVFICFNAAVRAGKSTSLAPEVSIVLEASPRIGPNTLRPVCQSGVCRS